MEVVMNQIVESLLANITPGWVFRKGIGNAGGHGPAAPGQ